MTLPAVSFSFQSDAPDDCVKSAVGSAGPQTFTPNVTSLCPQTALSKAFRAPFVSADQSHKATLNMPQSAESE